jgi:hypothetical protein
MIELLDALLGSGEFLAGGGELVPIGHDPGVDRVRLARFDLGLGDGDALLDFLPLTALG